ncbi:MAG TPA: phage holin family protein [Bacillales bacterium]|nr:phage holin family protein [Bacillales bacterium]
MTRWLIHIVVNSIVLIVVAGYIESFHLAGVWAAVGASVLLALINTFIKPILVLLTLPVTAVTLGLFLIVINAVILMLTAGLMGEAFDIDSFGIALLAAVIISILNMLIEQMIVKPLLEKK